MRVSKREFQRLALEAHKVLVDAPLRDVSAIDLPGGGPGRTLSDLNALIDQTTRRRVTPMVRLLFWVRQGVGKILGWDSEQHAHPEESYRVRIAPELASRSQVAPGTQDGSFRILYQLDHEILREARNATVHAFLVWALEPRPEGYRLYWAVYVKSVSAGTPIYMALIEPFRRFLVYPALLNAAHDAWVRRYGAQASGPPIQGS